jgi:hypothetical protein
MNICRSHDRRTGPNSTRGTSNLAIGWRGVKCCTVRSSSSLRIRKATFQNDECMEG